MTRMTTTKDTRARRLAIVALFVAIGAFMLGRAEATPTTEPDAFAVSQTVQTLNSRVADLEQRVAELEQSDVPAQLADLDGRIDEVEASDPTACMAYSNRKYLRERNGRHGLRFRMPMVVWNTAACPLSDFASHPIR